MASSQHLQQRRRGDRLWQRFGCILLLAAAIMLPLGAGDRSSAQQVWPSVPSLPDTGIQPGLTRHNRRLDCFGLRVKIDGDVEEARNFEAEARKEEAAPPVSAEQMFEREAGDPQARIETLHQLSLMRRRLRALADRYAEKVCGRLDPASLFCCFRRRFQLRCWLTGVGHATS